MKKEEFENKMNSIQKKLGKEKASLIADELGLLMTDNAQMNKELENKDNEISKLKTDKENLQEANINLLQQIPMGDDFRKEKEEPEEKKKEIDFRSAFDEKGNFKR